MAGVPKYSHLYEHWKSEYLNGSSTCIIAKKYGVNQGTVYNYINKNGLIRSPMKLDDNYQQWIELYINGNNTYEIADIYKCNREAVRKVINNAGIMRTKSDRQSIYGKYHDEWIMHYKNGMSTVEIGNMYGCNNKTVWKVIDSNSITRSTGEGISMVSRMKYADTDTYFDMIDSEGTAYFIGLILADGCIHGRKGMGQQRLSLSQVTKDGYMVELLANILGRNTSYKAARMGKSDPYLHSSQISVSILSDHIVNTLRGYGFTERKSTDNHEAEVFKHIPTNLMHHFIRGIVDGDGSIGLYGKPKYGRIQVAGNRQDMIAISDIFVGIGCRMAIPHRNSSIYVVTWSAQSDVTKIIHYLYDDATIYLKRKKQKADEILEIYNSK